MYFTMIKLENNVYILPLQARYMIFCNCPCIAPPGHMHVMLQQINMYCAPRLESCHVTSEIMYTQAVFVMIVEEWVLTVLVTLYLIYWLAKGARFIYCIHWLFMLQSNNFNKYVQFYTRYTEIDKIQKYKEAFSAVYLLPIYVQFYPLKDHLTFLDIYIWYFMLINHSSMHIDDHIYCTYASSILMI